MDDLRLRAANLLDLKIQFDIDITLARKKYPNNEELKIIMQVYDDNFHPKKFSEGIPNKKQEDSNLHEQHEDEDNTGKSELNDQHQQEKQTRNELHDEFILCTEDIENIEQVVHVHNKKKEEEMKNQTLEKDNSAPSFSLGIETEDDIISTVCKDINQNDDTEETDNDTFITPNPALIERSKREVKMGPYGKSPYIDRVIDITAKYTNQDIALALYIAKTDDPL